MKTIFDLSKDLQKGNITSFQLCSQFLKKISKTESDVNAFLSIDNEKILNAASMADERRKNGKEKSDFDGVPIAVKDNIAVKNEKCSCASKILEPFLSPYDATVITKLKDSGMIPFGRTNMDEFAMGSSCENSAFKKTKNPVDFDHVPGGSSGGSAAAVAAEEVPAALGSDTGGSIRQPASFCGIVGFKPTYGRVSRYGLVAYASSLDQIGPLTSNVKDAALIYDIIKGHDKMDSTSLPDSIEPPIYKNLNLNDLNGCRFGLPVEYFNQPGLDPNVRKKIEDSISVLKKLGAEVIEVSLPHTKYAIAAYYVIATAEASANLARFDGIRYGKRVSDSKNVLDTYLGSRGEGFGEEVKRRILLGTFVLSSGYYDAYYLKAQKVRTLIIDDFKNAYKQCDFILSPTSPVTAFKSEQNIDDPLQMYLADIYTISLNLTGACGISLPCGSVDGLPVGMQIMAAPECELQLLRVADVFENAINENI